MLPSKHFFQKPLGIRRTGLFASTVLPIIVLLVTVQSVMPAYTANARTARLSATLSAGCIVSWLQLNGIVPSKRSHRHKILGEVRNARIIHELRKGCLSKGAKFLGAIIVNRHSVMRE